MVIKRTVKGQEGRQRRRTCISVLMVPLPLLAHLHPSVNTCPWRARSSEHRNTGTQTRSSGGKAQSDVPAPVTVVRGGEGRDKACIQVPGPFSDPSFGWDLTPHLSRDPYLNTRPPSSTERAPRNPSWGSPWMVMPWAHWPKTTKFMSSRVAGFRKRKKPRLLW